MEPEATTTERHHIYMPLRSNAAWFESDDTRSRLDRQVKVNLMLYDRIRFQNGRWKMTAGEDGQGMEFLVHEVPGDRHEISYCAKGDEFGVMVNNTTVLRSRAQTAYEADFYPLIHDAGLYDTAAYDWFNGDVELNFEFKQHLTAVADRLIREGEDVLPQNSYLRKCLVNGLLKDSVTAHLLKMPLSVDYTVAPLIVKQMQATWLRVDPELKALAYDRWIRFNLPDFGEWSWDQVLEVRESPAGMDFRQMVRRVCTNVKAAIASGATEPDIDNLIGIQIVKELIAEVQKRRPTVGSTAFGLLLNVIPFGNLVDSGKELLTLATEHDSWFGIVGLKPKGPGV